MEFASNRQGESARKRTNGQTAMMDSVEDSFFPPKPNRNGAVLFSAVLFVVSFLAVTLVVSIGFGTLPLWGIALAFAVAALMPMVMHIAMEWERLVIFRFGAFNRVAGPGLVFTIPVIEQMGCRVDMRTISTPFGAEQTLTSDLVPVNIDAVLFWMVWDAEKACTEVEDYGAAVRYIAQTTLREAIGRQSIAEVALSRDQLDKELEEAIVQETEAWGIAVVSVKVRDIVIPDELQDVMSLEAQAERERNARIILAGAEQEIAEMVTEAGNAYGDEDAALKLRTLHLLYESMKESGGTVVALPSSLGDSASNAGLGKLVEKLRNVEP